MSFFCQNVEPVWIFPFQKIVDSAEESLELVQTNTSAGGIQKETSDSKLRQLLTTIPDGTENATTVARDTRRRRTRTLVTALLCDSDDTSPDERVVSLKDVSKTSTCTGTVPPLPLFGHNTRHVASTRLSIRVDF